MAEQYVYSLAAGLADGSSWTDAETRLQDVAGLAVNDIINIASDHDMTTVASRVYTLPDGITIRSVNRTTGAYERGALEGPGPSTGTADASFSLTGTNGPTVKFHGMDFIYPDDANFNTQGGRWFFEDCSMLFMNTFQGQLKNSYDSQFVVYRNSVWGVTTSISAWYMSQGTRVIWDNVTPHASHVSVDYLFEAAFGGNIIEIYNTDLAAFLNSAAGIIKDRAAGDDHLILKMRRCKLPTSWVVFKTAAVEYNYEIDIAECDTGDGYSYFYYEIGKYGQAEFDTAVYTGDSTFDGTTAFSVAVDTLVSADPANPFAYKIHTFGDIDLTTSKTITIEFTGPSGLKTNQVALSAVINDTTDEALGVAIDSKPTDPYDATTALTAGTATWTGGGASNYKIDLVLGAQTGVDHSNIDVEIHVGSGAAISGLNFDMPTIA